MPYHGLGRVSKAILPNNLNLIQHYQENKKNCHSSDSITKTLLSHKTHIQLLGDHRPSNGSIPCIPSDTTDTKGEKEERQQHLQAAKPKYKPTQSSLPKLRCPLTSYPLTTHYSVYDTTAGAVPAIQDPFTPHPSTPANNKSHQRPQPPTPQPQQRTSARKEPQLHQGYDTNMNNTHQPHATLPPSTNSNYHRAGLI